MVKKCLTFLTKFELKRVSYKNVFFYKTFEQEESSKCKGMLYIDAQFLI